MTDKVVGGQQTQLTQWGIITQRQNIQHHHQHQGAGGFERQTDGVLVLSRLCRVVIVQYETNYNRKHNNNTLTTRHCTIIKLHPSSYILSLSLSLSLIPGREGGGGSPPQSAPGTPRGVVDPCWILPARCLFWPGHELDTGAPGARRLVILVWWLSRVVTVLVGHINEVTRRWAGLVQRWVTIRGVYHLRVRQSPRPSQPGHPSVGGQMTTGNGHSITSEEMVSSA